ncbi:pilin N-terminal domain-containing protein [Anaerococcus hydrogenalis]|uniref:LPXTG-motif cell wall anchor domain protein n=1 Tax=Anaerococcus hydrogenalis ACS-025-V-Sch4 TaxID=879306 RepID=F0H132_9FIRM|nr:pilin N-terminal domain-containing protein [Anaerococcus hydrogenalis]EGC83831.1 LPXTG-motif cell wall anchor domain protein [Anaerococcus hydrogenalis ACS-025-V-Sch4]
MKHKILSFLTAFAMVFGIIAAPFVNASAADEKTNSVTVHKLLAKEGKTLQEIQNALKDKYVGSDKYLEGENEKEIKGLYTDVATEIPGVFFAMQKQVDGEWKYIAKDGKSVATIQDPTAEGFAEGVLGGETTPNGYEFDTSKLDQSKPTTYKIVEIHSLSSYKSKDGKVLTDKLAVPVEITLPLVNDKGVVTAAHVYPKNTEDKPQIDKNFDKEDNGDTKGIKENEIVSNTKDLDIKTNESTREKSTAVKSVGQSVPYKVVTEIPAQTKWATAKWDDKMTEGLTYNKDLSIELKKGDETVTLTKGTHYTLEEDDNGFVLNFTKAGLELLNNKAKKQTVTLKYTAKVNDKSVVKVPESNDITFHYGNNPGHGNTPKPNKPNDDGELKATKTWADGKWAKNEKAKFKLVDANTGKDIEAKDLVEPTDASKKAEFEAYKKDFKNEQEIGYGETTEAVWKYLDKNREYKVVETSVTYVDENNETKTLTGWEAEYAVKGKGKTEIKNYLTNNPTPLNPSEPKVVTYGAKFVKTNVEGERLPGAEFVVKNADGKFLVEGTKATRTEYEKAQTAFVDAVKAYNAKVKKGETPTADEKANVEKLEKARDAAWNATLQNMDGFTADKKDAKGVLKLKSNELGQFEIAGLKPGKYTLVEVKAPKDYVDASKATLEFGFTIGNDGEQDIKDIDFGIKDDKKADNAQKIVNKKVTIPQTGGIGSIIFVVAGLMIMGLAAYKMKANKEQA